MVGWHQQWNGQNLDKLWEMMRYREAWHAAIHGVEKSRTRLSDLTELNLAVLKYISFMAKEI